VGQGHVQVKDQIGRFATGNGSGIVVLQAITNSELPRDLLEDAVAHRLPAAV